MPAQGTYDPRLLARARSGQLTRSNTRPGTPERKAVDRVTYLKRREARPELPARQALGGRPTRPVLPGLSDTDRQQLAAGLGDPAARRRFARFRDSGSWPSWLPVDPADMDDQTAAILLGLPKAPNATDRLGRRNGWKDVTFTTLDGGLVKMTVTPVRGRPFDVVLPDSDSARQVLGMISKVNYPGLTVDVIRFDTPQMGLRKERRSRRPRKKR